MGHLQHAVPAGAQELLQLVFGIKAQAGNLADHVGLAMGAPGRQGQRPVREFVDDQVVLVHLRLACG